jgi:hypothetical protein
MQRMLQVLFVLAISGFGGAAGAATIENARFAAVDKAADEFIALSKDSYKTGQPPRQTDGKVGPLLDTVFNTAGVNEGPPAPMADLDKLNEWMLRVVRVGSVYVFAGTGIDDLSQIKALDQKQQQQITKNTAAFAPEIGRYFDAEIDLEHALIDAVDAEMKAHPEKYQSAQSQGGLAKLKGGLKQTLGGALSTFVTPGISVAWMRARLRPLTSIAPSIARSLAEPDRRQLADLSREVAGRIDDAEVKGGLQSFAKVLNP